MPFVFGGVQKDFSQTPIPPLYQVILESSESDYLSVYASTC